MKNRIVGLDIMRSTAILMVVFSHSSGLLSPLAKLPIIGWGIGKLLAILQPLGFLGVELFFVLSGFLIGSILIKSFCNSDNFTFKDIKAFWIRRWFRTLPNYFLILSIVYILYNIFNKADIDWTYFFFLQNFFQPHPNFFPEAWSLSIEEWFYLSLPLYLFFIKYLFNAKSNKSLLRLSFISYLMFFLIIRVINGVSPIYGIDFDTGIRKIVIFRLDSVMYGVICSYFLFFHKTKVEQHRKVLLQVGLIGIIVITFVNYIGYHPAFLFYYDNHFFRFFINAFLLLLVPLFFAFCIPYAHSVKTLNKNILKRIITYIAKISYSMYLTHFSLLYLLFFISSENNTLIGTVLTYTSYWFSVILLSGIIYKYFEKPIMDLRDNLR